MTRKTRKLYDAVLNSVNEAFKEQCPCKRIKIDLIVTDYEEALMDALKNVFSGAEVKGCWFHYGQVSQFLYRGRSLCIDVKL